MSELWIVFLVSFVVVGVVMMIRHALGRNNLGRFRAVGGVHASAPPWRARVLFWTWFAGFFIGWFVIERMAVLRSIETALHSVAAQDRIHSQALIINATWWLVWGFLPAAVTRSLGSQRFNAFKAVVVYHMRHSFRSCVVLWLASVGVLAGLGAWGLAD